MVSTASFSQYNDVTIAMVGISRPLSTERLSTTLITTDKSKQLILLGMIANLVVQSDSRTLFTMLFCSQRTQQYLIQESSFVIWDALFDDSC